MTVETKAPVENEWPARIEVLAAEAEVAALKEAPAKLAEYRAAHKADAASYKFDCRRHGDFLTVFMERGGRKESTTLNLGNTVRFTLSKGHAPDNKGVLTYDAMTVPESGAPGAYWSSGSGVGWTAPSKGYRYEVTPQHAYVHSGASMVVETSAAGAYGYDTYSNRYIHHRTPNYPRPAEDDRVEFSGIGVTLTMPAGKGQAVLDRIHAEVAKS